jgi:sporulation protein YunB
VRPVVIKVAQAKLNYISNKIVNTSVEKHFKDVEYKDIVNIMYDNENKISAVSIDFSYLNTLKSRIMLDISQNIDSLKQTDMKIPLGSFLNNEFFMGVGPDITFQIVPYGMVYIDFRDAFSGMGINQTVHEIYLDVKMNIGAVMPGIKATNTYTTSLMIAHTVIVGNVPDNYTGVNEIQGQIEDYILDDSMKTRLSKLKETITLKKGEN